MAKASGPVKLRPKPVLFFIHRWFGIALCALFVVWFATGIVMMYVEYPELTEAERLDSLPSIDAAGVRLSAAEAVALADQDCALDRLSLSRAGARSAFHLRSRCDELSTVFADDGALLHRPLDPQLALQTVQFSGFADSGARLVYEGSIDMDQWTVSEVLTPHRPLHRVRIEDGRGTVVYVSDSTGQIVRDTNSVERFWNWVGSTLHWIYPYQLRRHRSVWVDLIVYLSIAGLVSIATGAVIGFMRYRPRRGYGRRGASPYRGIARWHHLLGLGFLLFTVTFMFSGLMSMTPWGIFEPRTSIEPQIDRYTGGALEDLSGFPDLTAVLAEGDMKEVQWLQVAGAGHIVIRRSVDRRTAVAVDAGDPGRALRFPILADRIGQAAPAFLPDASIVATDVIAHYDDYYYSRHNAYRPLPVYRIEFDDTAGTWFYVDLHTGEVVLRHTRETRLGRWLFNGLHSLDFAVLRRLGPGWDVIVIVLSLTGLGFSVTSVVLGWRRLRRSAPAPHRAARSPISQ